MAGTKMLGRTKEEKDKIKDLMNKNIAQRKADKPVTNNHYALAGLKQYAKVQSELEQDGGTMNVRSKDSTIGKLIGREKFIQSGIKDPINNMKEHAALVEQAKKNNIETALSQATKNYTNNKKDLNSATENVKMFNANPQPAILPILNANPPRTTNKLKIEPNPGKT